MRPFPAAALFLVSLLFAGCVGGDEAPKASESAENAEPDRGSTTVGAGAGAAATGGIEGVVEAEGGGALAEAAVTLRETTNSTALGTVLSGPDGEFRFERVPAGTHQLEATAPGYDTAVMPVTVTVGKVATVEIALPRLATSGPFNVTTKFAGHLTCWFGLTFGQTECTGLGGHARTWLIGLGPNATDPVNATPHGVVVEAQWTDPPAGATAPLGMTLLLADPESPNSNSVFSNEASGETDPPPRVAVGRTALEAWENAAGGFVQFQLKGGAFGGVGYAVNLDFQAIATVFYDGDPDLCWSAMSSRRLPDDACTNDL